MQVNVLNNRIEWKVAIAIILGLFFVGYFPEALAQEMPEGFDGACASVEGFMASVVRILGAVSVGVVTVAVIFAGYQIAFAHKRLSDVAPILVGGLLIGGAGTIATWFVSGTAASCTG